MTPTDSPAPASPRVLTSPFAASAFTFAVFALLLTRVFLAFPLIPDYDSYYHLAAAREYATHGTVSALPWPRFSVMADHFGDKEFIFHWLLTPFVSYGDPSAGGRLALALLNALIAAVIANLAVRAIGGWGLAIAPLMYLSAASLMARSFRLRPEIGSLILLLLIIPAAAKRRTTTVVILTAIYALSYTAFHVAIGLMIVYVVADWLTGRPAAPRLVGAAILGAAIGLLIHPQFPDNLRTWFIQNVLFFLHKGSLGVGNEILAPRSDTLLTFNAGWWLALALIWLAGTRRREPRDDDSVAWYFGLAAAIFGVLWLLMDRMSIYFIPLATMAVLFAMRRRGLVPGQWSRIGRIRVPLALGLALAIAITLPGDKLVFHTLKSRGLSEADVAAMGMHLPEGAKVAAPWGETEEYVFWAPQARYLDLLDPIFMAAKNPKAWDVSGSVFRGAEPDTPSVVSRALRSDYIAFIRNSSTATLESRLRADPRVETLYAGQNYLGRFRLDRSSGFIRDWSTKTGKTIAAATGWVDLTGSITPTAPCAIVVHDAMVDTPTKMNVEFAAWGPAIVRIDDRVAVATRAPSHAILGQGLIVPIDWQPGRHSIAVETCRSGPVAGFYALRR